MWKCTLVLFYYLSTLLGTTFISLIDSAPVNFTESANTVTLSSPAADDDDSLLTTQKIVGIVGGITAGVIAIATFVVTMSKLQGRDFCCKCCKKRTEFVTREKPAEEEPLTEINETEEKSSTSTHTEPSSQKRKTKEQEKYQEEPVKAVAGEPIALRATFRTQSTTDGLDIHWFDNKNKLIPNDDAKYQIEKQSASSKLTIKNPKVGDAGNYRCEMTDSRETVNTKIKLIVTECDPSDVKKTLDFKKIKASMKKKYDESKSYIDKSLPGEAKFQLNYKKEEHFMPLSYRAECLDDEGSVIKYRFLYLKCIEKLIQKLVSENKSHRIAQCTADAGCGKTIFANKLTYQWLYDVDIKDANLKDIELIIKIPLRNVDPGARLAEMIGDGKRGLKYFDQNTANRIEHYLKNEPNQKCLIIIDGADEKDIPKDCELYHLISGKVCKETKVLVIGRPEAKLFTEETFVHYYKVTIHGTTDEGAEDYIKRTIEEVMNEQKVKQSKKKLIRNECNKVLNKFEILTIPLYVYLVVSMFTEQIAAKASFSELSVPTTATELFNGFFRILIRRWAEKNAKNEDISNITFQRNPFNECSTLPMKLQQKLFFMVRFSYKLLKERKYEFSNKDLIGNFISPEDIKISGLFCHTDTISFYRHKLMLEYMAALYLVHPCCSDKIDNVPVEKKTLTTIFDGLLKVPQFIFGIEPSKGKKIIESLTGHTLIDIDQDQPDISYSAVLCNEANDENVTEAMIQLLCDSKPHPCLTSLCATTVCKFYKSLTSDQAKSLLSNWYNLQVDSEIDQWCLVSGNKKALFKTMSLDENSKHLSVLHLNKSLMTLINHVCTFQTVSSAKVSSLSSVFPKLQELKINLYNMDDEQIKNTQFLIKSMPKLSVLSLYFTYYQDIDITEGLLQSIIGITTLRKLHLYSRQSITSAGCRGITQMARTDGVSEDSIRDLVIQVHKVNQLTNVGIGSLSRFNEYIVLRELLKENHMSSLEILYGWNSSKEEHDALQIVKGFQERYPNLSKKIKGTPVNCFLPF